MKIAIIGAGRMGSALARGLAHGETARACDITVSNPSTEKSERLQQEIPGLNITTSNIQAAGDADLVILAVKPNVAPDVLAELPLRDGQMLASIVAGLTISDIAGILATKDLHNRAPAMAYFRVMPNIAAAIGRSMTLVSSVAATPVQVKLLTNLLAPLGPVMTLPEEKLNAATALASCGMAYVLTYIRAAVQAGVELGLRPDEALQMTAQCVIGAGALIQEKPAVQPSVKIEEICTPGGYTIRGLNELEHAGFASAVIRAIKASV